MTEFAARTENPLRKIWEGPRIEPNSEKEPIKFQIGDPTIFKNFKAAPESVEAIRRALDRDSFSYTVNITLKLKGLPNQFFVCRSVVAWSPLVRQSPLMLTQTTPMIITTAILIAFHRKTSF